ncbi:MAG: hypothetical protein K6A30_02480 [Lachnospiraceae bacterium]|nr:hypothetical protein [Lachnospiraceae bacterium]
MRNRCVTLSKKLAAIILTAAMSCSLLAGCGATSTTEAATDKTTEVKEETTTKKVDAKGSGNVNKSETVYVNADAEGNVKDITVSDWLKNNKKYETVTDETTMSDVTVIKGSDSVDQSGNSLTFKANGNDVHYRGTVDKNATLPVGVSITYTLDGKKISADELKGATGHLKAHIEYTNNSSYTAKIAGKKKEIKIPFAATTIMVLSSDKVKNMDIDNGKILENGDTSIVAAYGFPGINESYDLDEGVFTDTVDFEADVEDYSTDMMMTFVTDEPFASSDLDDAIDLETVTDSLSEVTNTSVKGIKGIHNVDDLEDFLDDLQKDCDKLTDGAKKLNDGSKDLENGAKELSDNYKVFNSKLAILTDGIASAKDGGQKLASNMKTASNSSKKLATGAKQVSDGVSQLSTSMTGMYKTIASTISENEGKMAQLKQGMAAAPAGSETYMTYYAQYNQLAGANAALTNIKKQMDQAKLADNLAALTSGAKQVSDGTNSLSSGLGKLYTGTNTLVSGLNDLGSGSDKIQSASDKIYSGTKELHKGTVKLHDGTKELKKGTSKLEGSFSGDLSTLVDTTKELKNAAKSYETFTTLSEGSKGNVTFVIKTE